MKKKAILAKLTLLLTSMIWGAGYIFSQLALDHGFGPSAVMLGRFGIAAVLSGIIFAKSIRANMSWRVLARCIPAGLLLSGAFFAQTFGLKWSTPSNNALITAVYVILTPFMWRIVFKRRPHRVIYFVSVLCFIGVASLSVDFSHGIRGIGDISLWIGDLLTLLGAVLFAAQLVATEKYVGDADYKTFLFIEFATAALVSLAAFMITERGFTPALDVQGGLSVLYLGCLSTCLCYLMQTRAQRYVAAGSAALILSMEAIFGAVMSVLLGYDRLTLQLMVGGGIMLAVLLAVSIFDVRTVKDSGIPGVLRIGIEGTYAPHNWVQTEPSEFSVPLGDGTHADGYDIQLAKLIAERLGVELEIVRREWEGMPPGLDSGDIDMITGVTASPGRRKLVDFTDALYSDELVVVIRRDSIYSNSVSIADFAGAKLTAQLGTVHYDVIGQIPGVCRLTAMMDFSSMLAAVRAGKLDGYVAERTTARGAEKSDPDITYIAFGDGRGFGAVPVSVGVRKGSNELRERLNEILASLTPEERERIMADAVERQKHVNE